MCRPSGLWSEASQGPGAPPAGDRPPNGKRHSRPEEIVIRLLYAYDVALPNRFAATIQILKTARALCDLGHPVTLLCGPITADRAGLLDRLGIAPHPLLDLWPAYPSRPAHPALRPIVLRHRTRGVLRRSAPDILLSRGETGIALARLPLPPGTRRIQEIHKLGFLERAEQQAGRRLDPGGAPQGRTFRAEARALHAADGLIYLTPGVREAAETAFGAPGAAATVVPSGTDPPGAVAPRPSDVDLIYVGKIERRKGVFLLLDAMRFLPARRLRLIGDGSDLEEVRDRVRRDGSGDRIDVAGPCPHARIAEELARARVGTCLLPDAVDSISHSFTSPMKLLEMMAAGMPVVATDLPSIRNLCRDGVDALLAPPHPEDIAMAVERILSDPDLATRLGRSARLRAADFTWQRRAAAIEAFCAEVLARGPGPR